MPRGIYKRVKKVAQPVVAKKRGRPARVIVAPTVSVKEAIEVLARAVSVVDGLDIKVWDDAVLFDVDGSRYTATASNAMQVLDAIKLLASHKFD